MLSHVLTTANRNNATVAPDYFHLCKNEIIKFALGGCSA
ncbi:hypothetical protein ABEO63_09910 [Geobacillus stearothermophilus]